VKRPRAAPSLHIRVNLTPSFGFGPGKAALLTHVAATGSISAAARTMRMSYRRAWLLLEELNAGFKAPVVIKSKGGRGGGGGASLTPLGRTVLAAYHAIAAQSARAAAPALARLKRELA
jgi:molybdate transport system regulatory protein